MRCNMNIKDKRIKKVVGILLFTALIFFALNSCSTFKESIRYGQTVSKLEYQKFSYLEKDKRIKTKSYLYYYWYDRQKINVTMGNYSGGLLHGQFESFFVSNKSLKSKGEFDLGRKDGLWYHWDKKGNLMRTHEYREGLLNGKSSYYNESSKLDSVLNFNDGLKDNWQTYNLGDSVLLVKYRNGKYIKAKTISKDYSFFRYIKNKISNFFDKRKEKRKNRRQKRHAEEDKR